MLIILLLDFELSVELTDSILSSWALPPLFLQVHWSFS